MRLVSLTVLAAVAMTGSALATEAFIGQVGKGNEGLNIQLNQSEMSTSTAVIYQGNAGTTDNGHDALQVQIGDNNYAYTYQDSTIIDHVALTWQQGMGNNAVTVQGTTESTATTDLYKSQIFQLGDNNTAVNWQSDSGFTGNKTYNNYITFNPKAPKLTLDKYVVGTLEQEVDVYPDNWADSHPVTYLSEP